LTGDVGESRSWLPVESFVRFFFRNPRDGMRAAPQRWEQLLPGLARGSTWCRSGRPSAAVQACAMRAEQWRQCDKREQLGRAQRARRVSGRG
jgi:hypothetical protein